LRLRNKMEKNGKRKLAHFSNDLGQGPYFTIKEEHNSINSFRIYNQDRML
jgi:hypothetical protein